MRVSLCRQDSREATAEAITNPPSGINTQHGWGCVQVGLATVASAVQRAGGSVQHPSAELDDALEQKAAYIEGGSSPETSSLGKHGACPFMFPGRVCLYASPTASKPCSQ